MIRPHATPPFLPKPDFLTPAAVAQWYANIAGELTSIAFDDTEREHLSTYYAEAGLLRAWRQPFFRRHYVETFTRAAAFLLEVSKGRPIIDLGCGSGTQSLFLALCGAKVIGIDLDAVAIQVFRKRLEFYESYAARNLPVSIHHANVLEFRYSDHAPLGGLYSMFAFNMMQPSSSLLDRIVPHIGTGGGIAILDGNCTGFFNRLHPGRRRRVLSPPVLAQQLVTRGYAIREHQGGTSLPPILWKVCPTALLAPIDDWMNRHWLLPVSHQILAQNGSPVEYGKPIP